MTALQEGFMRSYTEQMNLDWYRQKTVDTKKRGNLSILLPQNGATVSRSERGSFPTGRLSLFMR